MKLAACILIPTGNTKEEVLAISRRNDITQWGIPGGKQDADETNFECAHREIYEETCLVIDKTFLHPLYVGPCYGKDGQDYWTTTYLYLGPIKNEVIPEDGLSVKPMELETLCDSMVSPFHDYNQKVLAAWRMFR